MPAEFKTFLEWNSIIVDSFADLSTSITPMVITKGATGSLGVLLDSLEGKSWDQIIGKTIGGNLSLSFPEKRDISLEFKKFIFKNNGRSLDFTAMKEPSNIYHKIFIPNSFMQRVEKHHKEYFKKLKKEKEILEKYKD